MRIALCEDDSVQADMFVRLLDKTAWNKSRNRCI